MKTFKQLVSEVAQPKPEEEKRFKDQHEIQLFDYPSPDSEFIFKGTTNKQMRLADQEGSAAYDAAYVKKEVQEESVDLTENPMEEKPMMMGTLRAMSHYIQGIARYVNSAQDPEEWFQNKLAGAAKEMQTLYGYATSEMMVMGESVEELHEAVKPGNLKLKDGSMVRISKQDAQLLNDLLGDLNPKNRKEMEKVMMTDTAGYDEILGFAREAL